MFICIKSILLILSSILENDSLLYEPGISKNHKDFNKYHDIIEYKNLEIALLYMLDQKYPYAFNYFYPIMKEKFLDYYDEIEEKINDKKLIHKTVSTNVYGMSFNISYKNLMTKLKNIYRKLK